MWLFDGHIASFSMLKNPGVISLTSWCVIENVELLSRCIIEVDAWFSFLFANLGDVNVTPPLSMFAFKSILTHMSTIYR